VEASDIVGIVTPTSETILKPDVAFSDFPTLDTNDLRTSLDLNSQFRSARGQGSVLAQYDRESTYSSELANPVFNDVVTLPTTPETGIVSSDTIRSLYTLIPTYTFDLTQRLNWEVTGTYQDVAFSGTNSTGYIPFEYAQGATALGWAFDQRLSGDFGVFSSYESSRDQAGQVNGYGVNLSLDYKVSTQFTHHLAISVERDDSQLKSPVVSKPATTNISQTSTSAVAPLAFPLLIRTLSTGTGATYSTTWIGQIQKVEVSVGRTFTPSGNGGNFAANQVQIEYQRDLGPRTHFLAAARYLDETSVSPVFSSSDYSAVNATASLKWSLTPTWYLTGGLEYVREHFSSSFGNGANGMVYVAVGYQGLGKRT
jgi:hypothetical protein